MAGEPQRTIGILAGLFEDCRAEAFRAGQRDMQERAAEVSDHFGETPQTLGPAAVTRRGISEAIRALPIKDQTDA